MCNKTIELCASGFKEGKRLFCLFLKPSLWFAILLICYYLTFFLPKNFYGLLVILVFFVFAHKCVENLIISFYVYINSEKPRDSNKLTALLGFIDRFIYAICFAVNQYAFIGLWLSIKIAQRLVQFKPVETKDDNEIRIVGERKNIFLIGNVISLVLGIMGGYLIIHWFNLPGPIFWKSL